MKWSKLKQNIEEKFADSLKGRLCLYATRYTIGSHWMARGWITLDGKEIAAFSTPDNYNKYGWDTPALDNRVPEAERTEGEAVEKGEFSRYEFFDACWEYLNINIDDALKSDNPIIKAFAVLDRRTGKRRLKLIDKDAEHPLVGKLLELRSGIEGKGITEIE